MSLKDLVRREISSSESGTSSGSDRFCACTWLILSLNLRRGARALLVTNQVQILLRRIMIPVAIMLWNKKLFLVFWIWFSRSGMRIFGSTLMGGDQNPIIGNPFQTGHSRTADEEIHQCTGCDNQPGDQQCEPPLEREPAGGKFF